MKQARRRPCRSISVARQPLEDARRPLPEPRDHRARQHDPQRRAADAAGRVRRLRRRRCSGWSTPTCWSSPGCCWCSARSATGSAASCALQSGIAIFGLASLGALFADSVRRGHRDPLADGRRRRADHARDAVDHRQRLPARGARQGDRDLGGAGRGRHRARTARRRPADRVVRLVRRVPGQRAGRARRACCSASGSSPRAATRGPGRSTSPARSLSTAGFTVLVYAIIEAPETAGAARRSSACWRWPSALLAAFVCWERRTPQPMLDLGFFRNARFSVGTVAVSVAFFALLGGIFALTQYLQFAHGYSRDRGRRDHDPARARADHRRRLVEPGGRAARHRPGGRRRPDRASASCSRARCCGTRPPARSSCSAWFFLLALSMGWVMAPATEAVVGAVPAARSGVASAMNTVARMVSGALGVAVIGSLVNSLYEHDLEPSARRPAAAPAREAAGESIGAAGGRRRPAAAAGRLARCSRAPPTRSRARWGSGMAVAGALSDRGRGRSSPGCSAQADRRRPGRAGRPGIYDRRDPMSRTPSRSDASARPSGGVAARRRRGHARRRARRGARPLRRARLRRHEAARRRRRRGRRRRARELLLRQQGRAVRRRDGAGRQPGAARRGADARRDRGPRRAAARARLLGLLDARARQRRSSRSCGRRRRTSRPRSCCAGSSSARCSAGWPPRSTRPSRSCARRCPARRWSA